MAYATVADLTVDQFKALMREVVIQTLTEVLGDPAEDLELRDDIKVKMAPPNSAGKTNFGTRIYADWTDKKKNLRSSVS